MDASSRMANWRQWDERRSRIALTTSFAILFLALIAAAVLLKYSSEAEQGVTRSLQIRLITLRLRNAAQAAQSAERGVIITGDTRYWDRFRSAANDITTLQQRLLEVTRENAPQQQRVRELTTVIADHIRELQETLELVQAGARENIAAVVAAHLKNDLMARVRALGEEIDAVEEKLLRESTQEASQIRALLVLAIVALMLAGATLVFLVFRALQVLLARSRDSAQRLAKEIEERETTEHQLRQAQKMEALGKLTGGVAHDFNNMLAVIVGNLDILSRHALESDARTRRLLSNALEGAKRAAELTQRLLAFSRLQPLAPKRLDVNKCIGDITVILQRTLGESVAVETVLGAGVWRANVDRPQLESAILNLALNAKHAMPEHGGRLTIETANTFIDHAYAGSTADLKAGQYVLIALTDTGCGMPAEVLERAFEPFFTTKPVGAGTGLGLSQVHGFIKQSGGHVSIYSEVNVGTTVKLYLPRFTGRVAEPDTVVQANIVRQPHDTRVLVVEDEQGVRQFAVDALRELGYPVVEADSAAAALRILETHEDIGVLLTDVVMPDMNGHELVGRVAERWPSIKVLYMTGYTRNAIVHNGVLDTGTRLLTKPFTLVQLETELQALLHQ